MSIPKKIHYCWLGKSQKPGIVENCISSWKKHLDDYEIVEWNESNINFKSHSYLEKMYQEKRYAFASDYVRLMVLRDHGGIYFDTDVLVKKNFDRFLKNDFFIGFVFDCALGTATIGATKNSPIISGLLDEYDKAGDQIINTSLFTHYFLKTFPKFRLNGKMQSPETGVHVYPREYFEYASINPKMGYARHFANGSWWKEEYKYKQPKLKRMVNRILGDALYGKLAHHRALINNEFYPVYKEHRLKKN